MIEFHLDARSGVAPYQQVVQQVRHALRLGLIEVGDQLPTVKEVVASLAINPNTVLKAYKELENLGPGGSQAWHRDLRHQDPERRLARRPRAAAPGPPALAGQGETAGLDEESIEALFRDVVRASSGQGVA